jgi:hypothetical protein
VDAKSYLLLWRRGLIIWIVFKLCFSLIFLLYNEQNIHT